MLSSVLACIALTLLPCASAGSGEPLVASHSTHGSLWSALMFHRCFFLSLSKLLTLWDMDYVVCSHGKQCICQELSSKKTCDCRLETCLSGYEHILFYHRTQVRFPELIFSSSQLPVSSAPGDPTSCPDSRQCTNICSYPHTNTRI